MKRKTRRILFWAAVLIFGLASWIAVRYAQGYKYDFSASRFIRTGTISVTANTSAKVFIDDKLVGTLSYFGNHDGQSGLLPGRYDVRLVRDGYSAWSKTVQVQEGLVTDFSAVMLLPTDEASLPALRTEAAADFRTITALPAGAKTVTGGIWQLRGTDLWRIDGVASGSPVARGVLGFQALDDRVTWFSHNEVWVLWVRPTNDQPFRTAGQQELVTRWSVPILHAAWFRDHAHVVVDLGSQGFRVIETDTRGGTNIVRF